MPGLYRETTESVSVPLSHWNLKHLEVSRFQPRRPALRNRSLFVLFCLLAGWLVCLIVLQAGWLFKAVYVLSFG